MKHSRNKNIPAPTREQLQPLIDITLQFDEETQELWVRLFELQAKQTFTEQEAEEFKTLMFKVRLAITEREEGPMAAATVAAEIIAFEEASNKAEQAGLSPFGVHLAAVIAEADVRGHSPSEADAEEYLTAVFLGSRSGDGRGHLSTQDILEAIAEVKRAGLWSWKRVN